jgi:hypothetical protein
MSICQIEKILLFHCFSDCFNCCGARSGRYRSSENDFEIIVEFSLTSKNTQKDILQKGIYGKAFKRLGAPAYDEVYFCTRHSFRREL